MFSGSAEGDDEEQPGNELAIDEDLTLVERVKCYCNSSISVQRLVHVRELSSCAEQIGAEQTLKELLPLLSTISSDLEISVRQALAEQMVAFCKVLLASPDVTHVLAEGTEPQTAYGIVVVQCVPVLSKLLSCDNTQVRTYVHGCLYSLLCRPLMRKVGAEQRGVQGRWLSRLLRGQAALALRPCRRLFPP